MQHPFITSDHDITGVQDSNYWFANGAAPEHEIGDVDAALDSFFATCFAAGPGQCSIWCPGGSSAIRSYFLEADRRIQHNPINVPQIGLFQFPQWRYAAYSALFQPSLLFRNLAQLVSEVHEGTAGDAITRVLRAQGKSGFPADPPLVDTRTKLSNGIESLWTIECLDRSLIQRPGELQKPRSIFEQYRAVSELGRNNAYYDIICDSELGYILLITLNANSVLGFPVRSKAKLPGEFDPTSRNTEVWQLIVRQPGRTIRKHHHKLPNTFCWKHGRSYYTATQVRSHCFCLLFHGLHARLLECMILRHMFSSANHSL